MQVLQDVSSVLYRVNDCLEFADATCNVAGRTISHTVQI